MHDALDSTRFKNGTPENVFLIAFKGTGNKMVIVAINKGSAATVPISIAGGTVPTSFIPYVTADGNNKNWVEGSAVSVAGGVLTAQLEGKSVTTFVGK